MSRRYFGTDGIRGRVGKSPINAEFVLKLGWAIGRVFAKDGGGTVLIGKDTRISGYLFESALEAGLASAGIDIHLLGPMPTPAIAYLTRTFRARAGIVISASHNLYYDNGIKFFSSEGTKLPDALEAEIEAQLELPMTTVESQHLGRAMRIHDAAGRYIEFCKSTVPLNTTLKGLTLVLDCANGATYHIAPNVFSELGATVIPLNDTPNGLNINDNCGAVHPETLKEKVLATGAHAGVAFDGDGDRLVMVDEQGNILDGDSLLYIMACFAKRTNTLKGSVVGTVMSNMGLEQSLEKHNISFVRVPVGDRHISEVLQKNGWNLGGEPSGHMLWLSANTTGDGIVSALQVLHAMQTCNTALSELTKGLEKYPHVIVNVDTQKKSAQTILALSDIQVAIAETEKQLSPNGRVLVRASGTEPLIRVMVEGENTQLVQNAADDLAKKIQAHLV